MSREIRLAELRAFNESDKSFLTETELERILNSSGAGGLSVAELNRKVGEANAVKASQEARTIVDDGSPDAIRDIVQRDTQVEVARRNIWILETIKARRGA